MFHKLLIANRSEIARRIGRTARKMGIAVVAVYSDADACAPFVREADERVRIGPPPPKESYLNADAILAAAKETGADAIHPGYGFLSENESFVSACQRAGVAFVGPTVSAMKAMSHKIESKRTMAAAGIAVVPGPIEALETEAAATTAAEALGYPVMLKASAGGGGIGMAKCRSEQQLRSAYEDARKKGETFFGSSRVFIEKLIESPHHIEVQIIADAHGCVRHLFDRECSIQRRHQKVLEETPSCLLDTATRVAVCDAAVKAARAVGYVNAGTVEFVADAARTFYFLEMNTRLQVEHPITEETLGIDIVEQQLRIAAGEHLALARDLAPMGHAIELRICAEDPDKRFFPQPGTLAEVVWPSGAGIRVDAGVESGSVVPPYYDSLLAKLIGHGATREQAIARLLRALDETRIAGIKTNLEMHKRILVDDAFRQGRSTTSFLEDRLGYRS